MGHTGKGERPEAKGGWRGELLESFKLSHARGLHQTLLSYTTV